MSVTCKNYRANENSVQLIGACFAHQGQVFADLYDENDKFIRTAVVADVGSSGLEASKRYAREANENLKKDIDNPTILK